MYQILIEALVDSAKTIPLLLIIYIGIELLEYKFGNQIREWVAKAGKTGPVVGAIAGSFPQCGFSVIATALYNQRLVTMGTLIAVYLSTSDEAIPIILAQPDKAYLIWPIIGVKILIAVISGYGIDLIFRKEQLKIISHIESVETGHDNKNHHHEVALTETACCGHATCIEVDKFNVKEVVWHPIVHTFNVFIFIFLSTLLINFLFLKLGLVIFDNVFLIGLIGLIPNCASSVAITQLYLKGAIGFGSVVAGLSASGGLGLLILWREEKNKKTFFKILVLLYVIAVIAGLVV